MGGFAFYKRLTISFFILSIVVTISGCDDDNPPVGPTTAEDYVFYFSDSAYEDRYFSYHTATGQVDTLTIPYFSIREGLAVSADGKLLYLSDGNRTVVVTSDSLELVAEIPYGGSVAVSPDNRLVAILGSDIYILNTSDYSVLIHDTNTVFRGKFSQNSERLYCAQREQDVIKIDLTDTLTPVSKRAFPNGRPWSIVPSVDESKWFLYEHIYNFWHRFEVYDVAADSVVFSKLLTPGAGDIEVTLDGKYLFYTNPGSWLDGPPPDHFITVFDIEKNEIAFQISTPSSVHAVLIPDKLATTPDNRILVVQGAESQAEFLVIDLATMKITSNIFFGNQTVVWNVACQNGL